IVVVASTSPLNFLGNVFSLFDRYPFPYLSQSINNLSVVIDPVFNTSWGLGYTYFYNSYVPFTVRTTINADRKDANVYVDGIFMGKSPVTTTLEAGPHTVYVYTERNLVYGPATINVQPGSSDFYFSLLPNYVYGYLEVTSIPDGQVYVDGQYAGDTPYKDFEKVGSHTVTVSKWGYHDSKQNVYINKDMVTSVSFTLTEKTEEEKKTDNIILFSVIGVLIAGIVIAVILGASD
ncbi:MAG: PEGA domain-containing protein, partial [Mesotoga sp.]